MSNKGEHLSIRFLFSNSEWESNIQ